MFVNRLNYTSICDNYCTGNYNDIINSTRVVCLHCRSEFLRSKTSARLTSFEFEYCNWNFEVIKEKDGRLTVMCPDCGIDAVIGNKTTSWTRKEVEYWHNKGF